MDKKNVFMIIGVILIILFLSILILFLKINEYKVEKEELKKFCVGEFENNSESYIFYENGTYTFVAGNKNEEGNFSAKNHQLELTYYDAQNKNSRSYKLKKDYKCTYIEKDNIRFDRKKSID